MKKTKYVLIAIILLFLATRMYKISQIPPSVYWDEASIGYNAYSILETGKDEWGQDYPIHFKAFGEYKLPVYIYSAVPFVALFGLNEFSVRIPAVIFSLITILLTYLLTKKISKNETTSLFAAFFLVVSPWFFIFSRTGYEAVAGLMFFVLGIYLFVLSLERPNLFILSSASFVLSLYSYNAFRVVSPIIYLVLLLLFIYTYKKTIINILPALFVSLIIVVAALIPIYSFITTQEAGYRLESVALESTQLPEIRFKKIRIVFEAVGNQLKHASPIFLFFEGDINERSQQNGFGQLYVIDLALLTLGIYYFYKKKLKLGWVMVLVVFVGLIPSSITKEAPHALRSITVAPFLAIIAAFGAGFLIKKIKGNKAVVTVSIALIYLVSFQIYYSNFVNSYLLHSSKYWQHGYKLLFDQYADKFDNYDKIVISDRYNQPYIFALFYNSYDPAKFREEAKYNNNIRKATSLVKSFDKYIFTNIDYYNLPEEKSLIFAHPDGRINEMFVKNIILHPDGSIAFYVYEHGGKPK